MFCILADILYLEIPKLEILINDVGNGSLLENHKKYFKNLIICN